MICRSFLMAVVLAFSVAASARAQQTHWLTLSWDPALIPEVVRYTSVFVDVLAGPASSGTWDTDSVYLNSGTGLTSHSFTAGQTWYAMTPYVQATRVLGYDGQYYWVWANEHHGTYTSTSGTLVISWSVELDD